MTDALSPALANHIGYLVKEAQALLHARMDEQLRPLGLTVAQYACLESLRQNPGMTSSELARRSFVSRQSMNVLLHSLTERKLVSRADQPGPHKQIAAELTGDAVTLLKEAQRRVDSVAQRMTADLDVEALVTLRNGLLACSRNLAPATNHPIGGPQ